MADDDADPTAVLIRVLRPDDDLDAQLELNERSFGVKGPDVREHWRQTVAHLVAEGRCLGAFAGDRPVGTAMYPRHATVVARPVGADGRGGQRGRVRRRTGAGASAGG